jgi:hypothetical protein
MRGGGREVVLRSFREWKGEGYREAVRVHVRRQWLRWPVGLGRKTIRRGGPAKG